MTSDKLLMTNNKIPNTHQQSLISQRIRVGVIFGGRSVEHEVSLVSAASVINALDKDKYEVIPIGIASTGQWLSSNETLRLLKEKQPIELEQEQWLVPDPRKQSLVAIKDGGSVGKALDVIFPVVHGKFGEDGALQGLLELADIPYVGPGVLGSAVGMDKVIQKELLIRAKIPTAPSIWFSLEEYKTRHKKIVTEIERTLKYPLFVKPSNSGSSIGINKAHNRKELLLSIDVAAQFDRKILVEQGINNAREIECGVLGNDRPVASVPGEIVPSNEFYDYDAKYVDDKSDAIIPAKLPNAVVKKIQQYALTAFRVLDCAGMARVDFLVTKKTNRIFLNEINTIPGFTSISMYPKLWQASGISYSALLDKLIQLALERHEAKTKLKTTYQPKNDWYK
ncbi:MAG: D-alanine--D-alanine ligase [Ignavibacteriales bacterium]|nr:D-alanine--D-alanine ligase [Ignavibacteriales bacterium]